MTRSWVQAHALSHGNKTYPAESEVFTLKESVDGKKVDFMIDVAHRVLFVWSEELEHSHRKLVAVDQRTD